MGSVCLNIASGKDKIDGDGEYDLYGSTGVIGKTANYSYQGDFILVARVGANAGHLTRTNGNFGVTDNTLVVLLYEPQQISFVYYSLESYSLNKLIFGSGQPLITGSQLKNLKLYFSQPEEQQRVANCLSSLDNLITAQTRKIEAFKLHHKGLMQQLFPDNF